MIWREPRSGVRHQPTAQAVGGECNQMFRPRQGRPTKACPYRVLASAAPAGVRGILRLSLGPTAHAVG
jgi:hypothetical protein